MCYTERTCGAIKGQINIYIFNEYGISYVYLVPYLHPDECLFDEKRRDLWGMSIVTHFFLPLKVEREERNQACSG